MLLSQSGQLGEVASNLGGPENFQGWPRLSGQSDRVVISGVETRRDHPAGASGTTRPLKLNASTVITTYNEGLGLLKD
jgi:hypothetical protein